MLTNKISDSGMGIPHIYTKLAYDKPTKNRMMTTASQPAL
jgi:acyl CoA:acetate/3-ketoacid CoA transferase alpha subunit